MNSSFENILFEYYFISWLEATENPKNRGSLVKPYSFPYKVIRKKYKRCLGVNLALSEESEFLKVSEYFSGPLSQYFSEQRLIDFCEKNQLSCDEYSYTGVSGCGTPIDQSEKVIRQMLKRVQASSRKNEGVLETTFYRILNIDGRMGEIQEVYRMNETKRLFAVGQPFWSKVHNSPIIDKIISTGIPRGFQIYNNRLEYYSHQWQENPHALHFRDLGYKYIPCMEDCCGLGFSILEAMLMKLGISLNEALSKRIVEAHIGEGNSISFGRVEVPSKQELAERI